MLSEIWNNPARLLATADGLVMQMRFDDAVPVYQRLVECDPTHVQAMVNLGCICRANDDFDKAEYWLERARAIHPTFRDLYFARATLYTQMGENDKSIEVLEQIADDIDATFLLATLYLARGDYARGFRLYRLRGHSAWAKPGRYPPIKPFDHWSEATDRTVAVFHEGGLGDAIQFVRYIPQLATVARTITLFVPATLHRLFAQLPDNVRLTASYEEYDPAAFDYSTSTVEMPYHFRTTIDTIPASIPYLQVPQEMIDRRRLPVTSLKRVGLCWAGGAPDDHHTRSYDDRRSFDLKQYAPLGAMPGIEFISLQIGQRAEQTCDGLTVSRVLDPSFDVLDSAAIIAQLDLVITVDTAIVHLAAAIGTPVWLLSRRDACWRWLQNAPNNPWYPSVLRVFGQRRYGDWAEPIADIAALLAGD